MFQHNANPCRSTSFCGNNNFAFILVLFILLVIIGASWVF